MTQTAPSSSPILQMLGQSSTDKASANGNADKKASPTIEGMSFEDLLNMDPADLPEGVLSEGALIRDMLLANLGAAPNTKTDALPSSLPSEALSTDELKATLLQSVGNTPETGVNTSTDTKPLSGKEDLIFLFNAPSSIYGNANNNTALTNELAATGDLNALEGGTLSSDMVLALMLQQQTVDMISTVGGNKTSSTDINTTALISQGEANEEFTAMLSAMGVNQMPQQPIAATSSTAALQNNSPANTSATDNIQNLRAPFVGNHQAGQSPAANPLNTGMFSLENSLDLSQLPATNNAAGTLSTGQSGTQAQNRSNSLKPFLMNNSALTPAQMNTATSAAGIATTAATPGITSQNSQNTLSFVNMFDMQGLSEGDALLDLPEFEHAMARADVQSSLTQSNPLMTAKQAGLPQPATQSIMQQINLMASRNPRGDSEMRMQLDPPELGNVMISMKFGRDNTVKAHLSVERPETLAMLQKDIASLQKTLQDSGLDVSQDSLSFDLQDQSEDGQSGMAGDKGFESLQNKSSGQSATNEAGEMIETEMTIFIDPQTGQQRINMMI